LAETNKQIKKAANGDDDKLDKEAILHEKVQTIVAPKMAEEALN
jgi:hypothetical protein